MRTLLAILFLLIASACPAADGDIITPTSGGDIMSMWTVCWDTDIFTGATVTAINEHPDHPATAMTSENCRTYWQSDFVAWSPQIGDYPAGSWTYLDIEYASAYRIGAVSYKLSPHKACAETPHPSYILLYAREATDDDWELISEWWWDLADLEPCATLTGMLDYADTVEFKYYKIGLLNRQSNYTACSNLQLFTIVLEDDCS